MVDFVMTLGGVAFSGFAIPEKITGLGGKQRLVMHELMGNNRVIDALGAWDGPMNWQARFRGVSALADARQIDAMRVAGAPVTLSFGDALYSVVISEFTYDVERFYEVPYSIVCEVVRDDTVTTTGPGVHEMMLTDNDQAQTLGGDIGDDQLSGLLSNLDTAIKGVSDFANAASSQIASVMTPILAVRDRVGLLTSSAENTLLSVTTVGGVLPSNPLTRLVSGLQGQVSAMTQVSSLYELDAITGRMGANLSAVNAGGAEVVTAGGDLFRLAEQSYGDATEWATIAKANGLTDPMLSGVQTILVPPRAKGVDGVLTP